jgi:hypothetical protein
MSSMMSAPIVGALAGNVLEHLRVEIDYVGQRVYLSPAAVEIPVVYTAPFSILVDGTGFSVLEVAAPSGAAVSVGDILVEVGGQTTASMPFAAVIAAMTSAQPARRSLVLERAGQRVALRVELLAV